MWTLKVSVEGDQILYSLPLLSNYCSPLTDDDIGLSWLHGRHPPPNSSSFIMGPVPVVSPLLFVETGSFPIWRAAGNRMCL